MDQKSESRPATAFIISPIGEEGSATREHADDVFDYIIKPAMEACSISCHRADHLHEPGKITEQMFREISTSDLCIAILTERNPNVYYELALAQAWNKPVIILIEKDEVLPFDIRDLRCLVYDLKPRNLFERLHVNRLINHVQTLESMDWKVASPFQSVLTSQIENTLKDQPEYYLRFSQFGNTEQWTKILSETKNRCDILSISLESWKNRTGFFEQLIQLSGIGCPVRLLQMHPDNPMLSDFGLGSKSSTYIRPCISLAAEFLKQHIGHTESLELRQIRNGCTHNRLIVLDDTAFISPYMYGNISSPLWRCRKGTFLYESILNEFETLWKANESI